MNNEWYDLFSHWRLMAEKSNGNNFQNDVVGKQSFSHSASPGKHGKIGDAKEELEAYDRGKRCKRKWNNKWLHEPLSASGDAWLLVWVENYTGYKQWIRKFRGSMKNATLELSSRWIFHRCESSCCCCRALRRVPSTPSSVLTRFFFNLALTPSFFLLVSNLATFFRDISMASVRERKVSKWPAT